MNGESSSIYANVSRTTVPAGTTVGPKVQRIMRRRIIPLAASIAWLYEVTVVQGTRLDLIATRELGEPVLAWMIYDVNNAMNPWDLLEPAGRQLRMPATQFGTAPLPEEEPVE